MNPRDPINHELQALRAIAVMLVVVHHLHFLFIWDPDRWVVFGSGMWVGVDLFFVISGYVIARGLLPNISGRQGEDFWQVTIAFWMRRFYRIAPSAWLWILLPLAAGFFFKYVDAAHLNGKNLSDIAAVLFHVKNIQDFDCSQRGGVCGDFHIYWSLSLEEQFYLLFPLLVLVSRKHLVPVIGVLIIAQFFLWRPQWGTLPAFLRTDALLFGVLIAIFEKSPIYQLVEPSFAKSRASCLLSAALIFSAVAFARYEVTWFYTGMVAVAGAVTVWACSYNKGYFIAPSILRSALEWIGARSFAIYLIHMPAYWITSELWQRHVSGAPLNSTYTFRFAFTAIVLIIVLADLNFRFIEEPLRKRGKRAAINFTAMRLDEKSA